MSSEFIKYLCDRGCFRYSEAIKDETFSSVCVINVDLSRQTGGTSLAAQICCLVRRDSKCSLARKIHFTDATLSAKLGRLVLPA